MQERLMKSVRHLTGSVGELVADGAIGGSDTVVDGGGRGLPLQTGLEPHVIEQRRFGQVRQGDIAGVMNALPP